MTIINSELRTSKVTLTMESGCRPLVFSECAFPVPLKDARSAEFLYGLVHHDEQQQADARRGNTACRPLIAKQQVSDIVNDKGHHLVRQRQVGKDNGQYQQRHQHQQNPLLPLDTLPQRRSVDLE